MERARTALTPFDPVDLAAGVGGLQLAPGNAGRLYSLDIAATIVAGIEPNAGLPGMSSASWRSVLNGTYASVCLGVEFEEPYENPFVDEITWDGVAYLYLPGLEDDSTYVLRRITDAISLLDEAGHGHRNFVDQAKRLCHAALSVADAVCRRARLSRGTEPGSSVGAAVTVPPGEGFAELKRAVRFSSDEMTNVLAPRGLGLDHLALFISDPGSAFPIAYGVNMMPALGAPIIRHEDELVVIGPQSIISLLRHALVCLAIDHSALEALASAYRVAVFNSVTRSLRFLGSDPLGLPVLPGHDHVATLSGFYRLDDDKAIHAIVVSDDLRAYSKDNPLGVWPLGGVPEVVEARLAKAEEFAFENVLELRELLHLVLFQGIGRIAMAAFVPSFESERSHRLLMSASDLDTIALAEGGTQLRLWQFARASSRFRESAHVMRLSTLDEFDAWRARGFSYYFGDEARPNFALVEPGGAGRLRREVRNELDWHGVRDVTGGAVEVVLVHHDPAIPIYFPWKDLSGQIRIVAEVASDSYWVAAPEELDDDRSRPLYRDLADMLAYWLWQLDPGLVQLGINVSPTDGPLIVRLEIEPAEAWFAADPEVHDPEPVRCTVVGDHELLIRFGPGSVRLLGTGDNAGERQVLKILLEGIAQSAAARSDTEAAQLSPAKIDELIEQFAPLGRKKKFFTISHYVDRRLDDRFLPPFRKVQEPDEEELLDSVGDFVINELGLVPGPIPDEQWTATLREVVSFLFCELERLVASLSPSGLLECLVAANEAILHEQAKRQLTIPTQLACFGSVESMVEHLRRELPEVSKAATASRVVIEFITAQPPNGTVPLSLAAYDRLLAIVSQLQNWAFVSDDIHFGLSGHDLDVLPSGRLGVGREAYVAARELFLGALAIGEMGRSDEAFERHWARSSETRRPLDEDMDAATTTEFGLSVSKLIDFLGEVIEIGDGQETAAKVVAKEELLEQLRVSLGWTVEEVQVAFDLFAALPRATFLAPPPPFVPKDAWPWNFNRALSYLRKPLLIRDGSARTEVVWGNRNIFVAAHYLLKLCSSGRLKARSPALQSFIGGRRNELSKAFNDRVADAFEAIPGLVVHRRAKTFGRLRIRRANNQDLGDIDVLVADPSTRRLLAIETKELAAARTPAELHNELKAVFEAGGDRSADIDRHLERVRWLEEQLTKVLRELRITEEDATRWVVEPLVVVAVESMAPYLQGQRVRVETAHEIRRELNSERTRLPHARD